MSTTSLITGASSGLGAEYARQLAARGARLVLVARDRNALDELAIHLRERFAVPVEVLAADLLKPRDLKRVVERIQDTDDPVELLINNAGFGLPLSFASNEIEEELRHLHLHVEVPMRLMHAALPGMLDRGHGRIVNVASVAAFMPRSTYGACKRWLVDFSRWATAEYSRRGVTVTAVCPGFTHTRFHERMGLAPGAEGVPHWAWLNAEDVVFESLRDIAHGKPVSVPSLRYKLAVKVLSVLPKRVAARVGSTGR